MFEDFVFPDGDTMKWESVSWLQKRFMTWFNEERRRAVITFPVETMNLLDDGEKYLDQEWADFAAEMWSKGHSFFMYRSDNVDSLASCCRLRNEIEDNQFSYTLGAGGVSTGSKCVITMNLNRIVQDKYNELNEAHLISDFDSLIMKINEAVDEQVTRIHKYLTAFNTILEDRRKAGLIPLYDAGFVSPERQYLTVGINGGVEAAEFLGCDIKPTDERYEKFMNNVLKTIYEANKRDRTHKLMFNTEFVPSLFSGHVKSSLIDLELPMGQQGASVMVA